MSELKSYSRIEIHLSPLKVYFFSLLFSWVLWMLVDFPVYREAHGLLLVEKIFKDLIEHIIEITVLFVLSMFYIRKISIKFWGANINPSRLIAQVLLLAILNGGLSVCSGLVYSAIYPEDPSIFSKIVITDYIDLSIFTTAYLAVFLLNQYRKEEFILLESQLKNLALSTDNHFVFNVLGSVSALIEISPAKAKIFLNSIIEIYRYLLINGSKTFVGLHEEVLFVKEYVKIITTQYKGVVISIDANLENEDGYILPVSLLMLVENAVKHNRRGPDCPLSISISLEKDMIVVTNNYQPLEANVKNNTRMGLSLLHNRYSYFNKAIIIYKDNKTFSVSIPILCQNDIIKYEGVNNRR